MVKLQSSARGDHQVNKNSAPCDRQDIYLEGFDSIPQVHKDSNVERKLHCDGVACWRCCVLEMLCVTRNLNATQP